MNGNLMNNNNNNSLPNSSKMMRNEKIINAFHQKDNKYGNNPIKKNQKQFNNNNANMVSQEFKNKNNNFDNRLNYKQQNNKNNINHPTNFKQMQALEDQGFTNIINNNSNQNININNNLNKNTPSLLLKLKVDKDKYEILPINLNDNPLIIQKKFNINEDLVLFIYKKIKDIMNTIEKIFDERLNINSVKDLNEISNILINGKTKDRKSLNGIKLMKFEKEILLRNYSFNSLNSYKYKHYMEKFLNSNEENKKSNDLNISN